MDARRTTWKRVRRVTALLALAGVGLGCSTDPNKRVKDVGDLCPSGVDLAVRVESLADVHHAVEFDSIAAAFPTIVSRFGQSLSQQLGFNLLDLYAAQSAGVRPDAPILVAFLREPVGATVLVLPGDGQRLADHLRDALTRRDGVAPALSDHASIPMLDASKSNTTILTFSEYVVVVSGIFRPDVRRQACDALIDGIGKTSLSTEDGYATTRMRVDGHVILFRSAHANEPDHAVWLANTPIGTWNAPLLGHPLGLGVRHTGAAVGIRLSPSDVRVTTATRVVDLASPKPDLDASRDFLDTLPASPKAAFDAFASGGAIVDWMFPPTAGAAPPGPLGMLTDPNGPVAPLLAEVEGHMGILVNELKLFGSDVVLYGQLIDPTRAAGTLARVVATLKETPIRLPLGGTTEKIVSEKSGDVPFYRLSMFPVADLCFGIVRGYLVATSTQERFNTVVAGGPSFLEGIRDTAYGDALASGALAALYVDLPATATILSGISPSFARRLALLSAFDTAFVTTDFDSGMLTGTWTVRSLEPGIWVDLLRTAMGSHAR